MKLKMKKLTIGTRTSRLAMWQTEHVAAALQAVAPDVGCEVVEFVTKGDKTLDKPLPEIGGKGLFTWELEQALLAGEIDLAVHSLKDLPVVQSEGLTLGAIMGRADVRDVVVAPAGYKLGNLPLGATVGTSSLRRKAQLLSHRPDLNVQPIRGNVGTRIRKVDDGQYQATLLAAAGVVRLGLEAHVSQWLPLAVMLPAPGQGALGVQCRADDGVTLALLAGVDNRPVRATTTAERSFLYHLGGGCSVPIAAYATWTDGLLSLQGLVAREDGVQLVEVSGQGEDAWSLGQRVADVAIARGALELLPHG